MPMVGNSHTDDPVCAWVAGSICILQIGVYHSGCLRDRVPLRGKGTNDRLPVDASGNSGQGSTHMSAGSTSGSASGPSESAGMGCGWSGTSSGHSIGSVYISGPLADPANNSWSRPGVESDGVSNTAGCKSGLVGLAVWGSSIPTGSSVRLGASGWGFAGSVQGLGRTSVVGCPLRLLPGLGGQAWRFVPVGLDTTWGSQSLPSYVATLQNRSSRASIYPHARSGDLPGGGVGSCTSLVPFWPKLTKVNG